MSGDYSNSQHVANWSVSTQDEEIIFSGATASIIAVADHADWHFGSGDWTIELFGLKFDANTVGYGLLSAYNASGNQRAFACQYQGDESPKVFRLILSPDGSAAVNIRSSEFVVTPGQAYDVCFERSGNTIRIYVDGTMIHSETYSDAVKDSTQPLEIGRGFQKTSNTLAGRMKAIRITKGVARYASDGGYTVPSLPLPTQGA